LLKDSSLKRLRLGFLIGSKSRVAARAVMRHAVRSQHNGLSPVIQRRSRWIRIAICV
jgi:hypothetical protein